MTDDTIKSEKDQGFRIIVAILFAGGGGSMWHSDGSGGFNGA
jgi:hypothetical protein